MMKSVPNFISYLKEFSQIFTHVVPIFLVWKGDFRGFLKLEKSLTRGARLLAAMLPCTAPRLAGQGGTAVAPVP
jgi:hypothetical protein